MALDGVHLDAIDRVVGSLDRPGLANDRDALAEALWVDAVVDGHDGVPIEPLEAPTREAAPVEEVALAPRPFEDVSAVDAGSLNPTTFQNGLVVDLGHAAMATTPSDVDRHRRRTIVAVAHGPTSEIRSDRDWTAFDDGHGRARLVAAPYVLREEQTAVHTLALEASEVEHALANRDGFGDLLLLDGSAYPASVLHWEDRRGELAASVAETEPKRVLEGGLAVVDACLADGVACCGFVKNWTARGLVRAIEEASVADVGRLPWRTDYGLFSQLLAGVETDEEPAIRWTSWFRMDYGVGAAMPAAIEAYGLEAAGDPDDYALGFMVVRDPRENVAYRVEAPVSILADDDARGAVTRHVVGGVARTGGPPPTLSKADALAGIGRRERRDLRRQLERALGSRQLSRYDDVRWPDVEAPPEA
ncbi:MAG: DNA double-strand break repair nuclease NurA [Halobacteriales archaeon]